MWSHLNNSMHLHHSLFNRIYWIAIALLPMAVIPMFFSRTFGFFFHLFKSNSIYLVNFFLLVSNGWLFSVLQAQNNIIFIERTHVFPILHHLFPSTWTVCWWWCFFFSHFILVCMRLVDLAIVFKYRHVHFGRLFFHISINTMKIQIII